MRASNHDTSGLVCEHGTDLDAQCSACLAEEFELEEAEADLTLQTAFPSTTPTY